MEQIHNEERIKVRRECEEQRNAHTFLLDPTLTPAEKITWKDYINTDLRKRCEGVNWTELSSASVRWGTFVNTVMQLQVP
jgi:hypothetical protein